RASASPAGTVTSSGKVTPSGGSSKRTVTASSQSVRTTRITSGSARPASTSTGPGRDSFHEPRGGGALSPPAPAPRARVPPLPGRASPLPGPPILLRRGAALGGRVAGPPSPREDAGRPEHQAQHQHGRRPEDGPHPTGRAGAAGRGTRAAELEGGRCASP